MRIFKILISVFLAFCVLPAVWISAYASELIPLEGYTEDPYAYPDNTQSSYFETLEETDTFLSEDVEETNPIFSNNIVEDFDYKEDSTPVKSPSDPVIVGALAPMTPANTNGFQAVILGLLGNYNPVVLEYAYTNSNGYTSYVREVQPDYSWMCSCAVFALVLYSLFRIVGGLIKR